MKDVTEIFGKAVESQKTYHYRTAMFALETDESIWCMHDPDSMETWAYIGKTNGNSMTEFYGYLCDRYPVALLKDNCPDKIKYILGKCGVMYTEYDEELACEESVLRKFLPDKLIIDDRFLEDETLPFNEEAFDSITDGYRYITPYKFAFKDLIDYGIHYTKSELEGIQQS